MDVALSFTNCIEHPHSSLILYQLYRYVTQPYMVVRPVFHTLSQTNLLYKYFESIADYDRLAISGLLSVLCVKLVAANRRGHTNNYNLSTKGKRVC